MAFKKIIMKLRRAMLCCSQHGRKQSLDIGSPTDVRRVNISDALPGLTDAERKYLREKASSDAIHLLAIRSQPPSYPPTSPPSPTLTSFPSPPFGPASREASEALLNAASKDLPSAVPTPPKQRHNENSPPAVRMKSMWEAARRVSESSSMTNDGLYAKLERVKGEQDEKKGLDESSMTLNLEFDWESRKGSCDSVRTVSLSEGFEVQGTVGGGGQSQTGSPISTKTTVPGAVETTPIRKNPAVQRAIASTILAESSDSESDLAFEEARPLVKV